MLEINGLIKNKKIDSTKFSKAIFKIENTDTKTYKNLTLSIYLNEGLYIKDEKIFINKKLLSFNKRLSFDIKEMNMNSSFILEFEIGIKKEFKEKSLDVSVQIMGFNSKGMMIVKDIVGYIKNENIKENNLDIFGNKLNVFIQSNKDKVKTGEAIIYKTVIINGCKEPSIFMYKLTSSNSINLLDKYVVDEDKVCKDYVTFKLEPNCGVIIKNKGKYYNKKDIPLWVQGILQYKFIKNNKIDNEVFKLKTEKVYLKEVNALE
ncbi:MAG: hypothetical protein RSF37_02000 [Clostridium sp.]|uniref:hypothetical protein n=1 Tax=Clostridium sp. TaxID=1506 RepID=UPI002FC8171D